MLRRVPLLLLAACLASPSTADDVYEDEPRVVENRSDLSGYSPSGSATLTPEGNDVMRRFQSEHARGRPVDREAYFRRVLQTEGPSARELISFFSRVSGGTGRERPGELAERLWKLYIESYGSDPSGYEGLGRTHLDAKDYGSAVADYTQAIGLGADSPGNFYARGLAAERLGDHEFANRDAAMALSKNPDDPSAYSLFKLTDGRVSKVYVNPATGALDKPPTALGGAAGALRAGAPPPGGGTKPKGKPAPDPIRLSSALTQAAQRHLKLNDAEAALAAAMRAVRLNPDNAQARNLIATARARMGDHEAAVAEADKALEVDPDSVATLTTRAWSYNSLHRFQEALSDAERALSLDPANPYGFLNKARALGGLGRREGMLEALARSAALDPRMADLQRRAMQLAPADDSELLFAGLTEKPAAGKKKSRKSRLLVTVLSVLVGGFLVALGLLHMVSSSWRERVTAGISRLRGGPSVGQDSVAGYELRRVIATGGMGLVYEGLDKKLGRRVAIKKLRGEIRDDPKSRKRFLDEAGAVASLQHPNIVQIFSVLEEGPDIYLVFEYVDGHTLEQVLKERGSLPWLQALTIMHSVCDALSHAHKQGVVHRDLKPSNIMITGEGAAKVMDFGVARAVKDAMAHFTATNTVWGTPSYMAPEVEEGETRRESDVYALGVNLYEILTGQTPFQGSHGAMYSAKTSGSFTPASKLAEGIPKGVDRIIAKALAPDHRKRCRSVEEFWGSLKDLT